VSKGFGRGGKLLGCPTANLDEAALGSKLDTIETGVYFGWAKLEGTVYKMVTSVGWNPTFHNDKKTVEPHILHEFKADFYGKPLSIVLSGRLRPELEFKSMEELISAIDNDKAVALEALATGAYDADCASL